MTTSFNRNGEAEHEVEAVLCPECDEPLSIGFIDALDTYTIVCQECGTSCSNLALGDHSIGIEIKSWTRKT